jgi:hypothetical protein
VNEYSVRRLALILSVQAEIEGMKARNITRLDRGDALAYSDEDFQMKAEQLRNLAHSHNEVMSQY